MSVVTGDTGLRRCPIGQQNPHDRPALSRVRSEEFPGRMRREIGKGLSFKWILDAFVFVNRPGADQVRPVPVLRGGGSLRDLTDEGGWERKSPMHVTVILPERSAELQDTRNNDRGIVFSVCRNLGVEASGSLDELLIQIGRVPLMQGPRPLSR